MARNALIAILMLVIVVMAAALVRTENQRYALSIGMCAGSIASDTACLAKVETRTGWWWHLYYALKN
jgi:uncharacterized transporter YbjL